MLQTTMMDIDSNGQKCPNCGHDFTKIEYYAGVWRPTAFGSKELTYKKHIGGLCRYCQKKQLLKYFIGFPILGAICLVAVIIGIFLSKSTVISTRELGDILRIIGGILLALCVFCYGIALLQNPNSQKSDEYLYNQFAFKISSKGASSSIVYYSPKQMHQLENKSKIIQ